MREREPLYVISVAAQLVGMHAQTLRKYERERFVVPSRTSGRLRLYSAADLDRLRQVKHLVNARGLNLAGVELALVVSHRLRGLRAMARTAMNGDDLRDRVEGETRELLALLGGLGEGELAEHGGSGVADRPTSAPRTHRDVAREPLSGTPRRTAKRRATPRDYTIARST